MRFGLLSASAIVLFSSSAVAAQDNAAPAPAPNPDTATSGSAIAYELPSTSIKVAVGMTLIRCVGEFKVKPDVVITSAVGPSEHREWKFSLDGRNLNSFWKSKKLALETYPSGAIKSLNGGLSDQTGAVITSVVKIAAAFAAMSSSTTRPATLAGYCSDEAQGALERVGAMKIRIVALRKQLATAQPDQVERLAKTVDALAAEVARLQTGDLHIDLPPKEFVLDQGIDGALIGWNSSAFAKWLRSGTADFPVDKLSIGLCFRRAAMTLGESKLACNSTFIPATPQRPRPVVPITCGEDVNCSATIVMREPQKGTVIAIAQGTSFDGIVPDAELKRADVVVSQWGAPSFLPLKVGFGKSINFAMGFDEYGHKTSQTWDTAARGAAILGTASALTDGAAGIYKTIDGRQLAEDKAEIDRISTQKALNQARFCKAVYDAGGFTCPE